MHTPNAYSIPADDPEPRKKRQFSEAELALKKEENARKRKNMVEKRLEDEKVQKSPCMKKSSHIESVFRQR